jgi:hypothetical protein
MAGFDFSVSKHPSGEALQRGPYVRAERLRVVLALCDGMPYLDPREAAQHGLPSRSPAEVALLEKVTEGDLALVNACLEIEQELRQRTYSAAERVLASAAGGCGKLDERILSLPECEAIRAMSTCTSRPHSTPRPSRRR